MGRITQACELVWFQLIKQYIEMDDDDTKQSGIKKEFIKLSKFER